MYVNKFYYMQSGILKVLTRSDQCNIGNKLELDSQLQRCNRIEVEEIEVGFFIYCYFF